MDRWPSLVNEQKCIIKFMHPEGDYAIYIVQNSEGTYCTFEEELSEYIGVKNWLPIGVSSSIYDNKEKLIAEIKCTNEWISNVIPLYNT